MVKITAWKRAPGRRTADKVVHGLVHYIKLASLIVGALSAAFLSGIGAFTMGYAAWQDLRVQMSRDARIPAAPVVPVK